MKGQPLKLPVPFVCNRSEDFQFPRLRLLIHHRVFAVEVLGLHVAFDLRFYDARPIQFLNAVYTAIDDGPFQLCVSKRREKKNKHHIITIQIFTIHNENEKWKKGDMRIDLHSSKNWLLAVTLGKPVFDNDFIETPLL